MALAPGQLALVVHQLLQRDALVRGDGGGPQKVHGRAVVQKLGHDAALIHDVLRAETATRWT